MPFGIDMRQERVPSSKKYMISTRANSQYKWQAKNVVGAMEVPSEPNLNCRLKYIQHQVEGSQDAFKKFMKVWEGWRLRDEFIKACENAPVATFCCSMLTDTDKTIKNLVQALNDGWIKATNERLALRDKHFRLDAFVWNWPNATGKAETNILLIRVFETHPNEDIERRSSYERSGSHKRHEDHKRNKDHEKHGALDTNVAPSL